MPILEPSKVKFYRHTFLPNENGCMLWKGLASKKGLSGYGKIRIKGGKQIAAHRFSYEIHYGKIPNGLHVLHKCDIPRCVAPDHLFLGTVRDNALDKYAKNRGVHHLGEDNPRAKFSNKDIPEILALREQGWYLRKIAKHFGVAYNTIWKIVKRISYPKA